MQASCAGPARKPKGTVVEARFGAPDLQHRAAAGNLVQHVDQCLRQIEPIDIEENGLG